MCDIYINIYKCAGCEAGLNADFRDYLVTEGWTPSRRGNGEQRNVDLSRGRAGGQQHAWMDRTGNRWFEVLPHHPRVPDPERRLHPAMEHRGGFVHEVLVRGPPVDKDVRHLHQHLQVCGMRGRAASRHL